MCVLAETPTVPTAGGFQQEGQLFLCVCLVCSRCPSKAFSVETTRDWEEIKVKSYQRVRDALRAPERGGRSGR